MLTRRGILALLATAPVALSQCGAPAFAEPQHGEFLSELMLFQYEHGTPENDPRLVREETLINRYLNNGGEAALRYQSSVPFMRDQIDGAFVFRTLIPLNTENFQFDEVWARLQFENGDSFWIQHKIDTREKHAMNRIELKFVIRFGFYDPT